MPAFQPGRLVTGELQDKTRLAARLQPNPPAPAPWASCGRASNDPPRTGLAWQGYQRDGPNSHVALPGPALKNGVAKVAFLE